MPRANIVKQAIFGSQMKSQIFDSDCPSVAMTLDKGKGRLSSYEHRVSIAPSSSAASEPESEDEITQEYLESLLDRARQNVASSSGSRVNNDGEDVITLDRSAEE